MVKRCQLLAQFGTATREKQRTVGKNQTCVPARSLNSCGKKGKTNKVYVVDKEVVQSVQVKTRVHPKLMIIPLIHFKCLWFVKIHLNDT